jgi:putrescine transport system substrate-binding protein
MSKRILVAAALAWLAAALPAAAQAPEIHVLNRADYIDPHILDAFTLETGIKVVYDTYDEVSDLPARLAAQPFDVAIVPAGFLARHRDDKTFLALDRARIPNLHNMWPDIVAKAAFYDPDNAHSVIYLWGTTGIGYNPDAIKAALPNAPANSWALFYKQDNLAKLSACGVMLLDSPDEVLPSVLNYLGLPPQAQGERDMAQAENLLRNLRPYLKGFRAKAWQEGLVDGEICAAMGRSGDIYQAAAKAEELGQGVEIDYIIPKEGAQMWFDVLTVPSSAQNPAGAYAFIDYLMRPDVIARVTNYVAFANAIRASQRYVDREILDNPALYPDKATLDRLYTAPMRGDGEDQALMRTWDEITAAPAPSATTE